MRGRYLLDSNIIIGLFSGGQSVIQHISTSDEIFLHVIVSLKKTMEGMLGIQRNGR
ncbi:MAG: hypothetical protein WBP41_03810 [Saprospiraceae bacterium]